MKRKSLLFLLTFIALSFTQVTYGQLNYNTFGTSNFLGTYTDLAANGTVIATPGFKDANSAAQNIGFTFNYNGAAFTQFVLNTNGFIKLGNTPPTAALHYAAANTTTGGVFNSQNAADVNLLAAYNHSLHATPGAECRMYTTGAVGSRTCTIQFKNLRDTAELSGTGTTILSQFDSVSFQIILYETTNVIDFVYGTWKASANPSAFKSTAVGLKGSDSTNASLLVVTKASTGAWSTASFLAGNYTGNSFNSGNPPNRPLPDAGRTFRFSPMAANDAAVTAVYTLGNLPIPWGAPRVDSAVISNTGTGALAGLVVTLKVSGATNFTTTKTIASLPRGASATIGFPPYTPATVGNNIVTVSVPADGVIANDTMKVNQAVSDSVFSYSDAGTASGSVGGFNGYIMSRYLCLGSASVKAANIRFGRSAGSVGKSVYAILLDDLGNKLDSSAAFTITAADTGKYHRFAFPKAPGISGGTFFVGLALPTAGGTFYPVGYQRETPLRNGSFFAGTMANPVAVGDLGGGANSYRLMIQAIVASNVGIVELTGKENLVTAFPNPSSNVTTFNISMDHVNNVTFSLYDVNGKVVNTASDINSPVFKMERENLPAGVYFYTFKDATQMIGYGKLVIE